MVLHLAQRGVDRVFTRSVPAGVRLGVNAYVLALGSYGRGCLRSCRRGGRPGFRDHGIDFCPHGGRSQQLLLFHELLDLFVGVKVDLVEVLTQAVKQSRDFV
ncbi:hypothetical protein [Mycobacterium parascrofulaceum]|uniref:hypothetical protein n=1 Tax=Mycobacterium parascrofulaceum TaxID=240125 RepID=UPI00058B4B6D|nr:hypothetical protein [Mycobacterium parascrofulaceum]